MYHTMHTDLSYLEILVSKEECIFKTKPLPFTDCCGTRDQLLKTSVWAGLLSRDVVSVSDIEDFTSQTN